MLNENQNPHPLLAENAPPSSTQTTAELLQSKMMSERQLFNEIKPQLVEKYGEEIANRLARSHATPNLFDKAFYSEKVSAMEEEAKKAFQAKKEHDTLESIYAKHNTSEAELKKALDSCRSRVWLESDLSYKNAMLGNPVFLEEVLNDYRSSQNQRMDVHAGVTPYNTAPQKSSEENRSRAVELARKIMSGAHLNFEEKAEYEALTVGAGAGMPATQKSNK